jgi:hypothetical protein
MRGVEKVSSSRLGQRSVGSSRKKREDNTKMDLRKIGCEDRMWIELAQDSV